VKLPSFGFFRRKFSVQGLNLERFLNLTKSLGIPLYNLSRLNARSLTGVCREKDIPALSSLAEEKGWRFSAGDAVGLLRLANRLKSRPGLLIGAVLSVALLSFALRYVWAVRIIGAGAYQADISAFLRENGIAAGTPLARIDAEDLETRLALRYPKITWFRVYASGITLVVECTHGRLPAEEAELLPGDVIAARDGIVTKIIVYAGTAAVKPGDVVKAGQLLIRGEERSRDGLLVPVRAKGEVTARCWQKVEVQTPLYTAKDMETGKEHISRQICTPVFSLPGEVAEPDFLTWNTYTTYTPIVGAFFPVTLKTVVYREVSLEYALPDQQQLLRQTRQAAEKKLAQMLEGYEIIDKWEDYCIIEDEKLSVSLTGEWQMDIALNAS
jgi:sporulation protein YqfD